MADVTSKVCDLCGSVEAQALIVREDKRAEFTLDLCPTHYSIVEEWREVGRAPSGARAYRRYKKSDFDPR